VTILGMVPPMGLAASRRSNGRNAEEWGPADQGRGWGGRVTGATTAVAPSMAMTSTLSPGRIASPPCRSGPTTSHRQVDPATRKSDGLKDGCRAPDVSGDPHDVGRSVE
jgi:hypothetical protein